MIFRIIFGCSVFFCICNGVWAEDDLKCYSKSKVKYKDESLDKTCSSEPTSKSTTKLPTSSEPTPPSSPSQPPMEPTSQSTIGTENVTATTPGPITVPLLTTELPTITNITELQNTTTVGDFSTDPSNSTSPSSSPSSSPSTTTNSTNSRKRRDADPTEEDINYCYIFVYPVYDPIMNYNADYTATFSCDSENYCKEENPDSRTDFNVTVSMNGINGTLYCCGSSYCNDMTQVPYLPLSPSPSPPSSCFQDDENDKTSPTIKVCVQKVDYCLNITDGDQVSYSCDFNGTCLKNGIGCHYNASINQTLCCCAGNDCNGPSDLDNPITKPPASGKAGLTPAYIVLYVFAGLVTIIILVFIVKAVRKKGRQTKNNGRLTESTQMTYSRLTEELAASESY